MWTHKHNVDYISRAYMLLAIVTNTPGQRPGFTSTHSGYSLTHRTHTVLCTFCAFTFISIFTGHCVHVIVSIMPTRILREVMTMHNTLILNKIIIFWRLLTPPPRQFHHHTHFSLFIFLQHFPLAGRHLLFGGLETTEISLFPKARHACIVWGYATLQSFESIYFNFL